MRGIAAMAQEMYYPKNCSFYGMEDLSTSQGYAADTYRLYALPQLKDTDEMDISCYDWIFLCSTSLC